MEDLIDRKTSQIICENVQMPANKGTHPIILKGVLLILRGMAVPGLPIKYNRAEMITRTQMSRRGIQKCLTILLEAGFINQLEKPAPGRTASYVINHEAMIPFVDENALIRAQSKIEAIRRARTKAHCALEREHSVPPSKSTGARHASTGARHASTGARHASTGARHASDLKEGTALPAIPAAAAAQSPECLRPNAERMLRNAAAAAAVMDLDSWAKIGRRAGLQGDLAAQCAHALVELGIEDAEDGARAMERLSERIGSGKITNAIGLMRTIVTRSGGPEPSIKSLKRDRNAERRRNELRNAIDGWESEWLETMAMKIRALLTRLLGDQATAELMPDGEYAKELHAWDNMLDFIAVRYEEIKAIQLEEVAA